MGAKYNLEPTEVPCVETAYRRIGTRLPVPESLETLRRLQKSEPSSMMGQPPVIWDSAEGFLVRDRWGNQWIDFSSGVLITNAGHGRPEIRGALRELIDRPLLTTYVFPHEKRAELSNALQALAPRPDDYRVFLLTTGSEAIENALKLGRTYALEKHGRARKYVVSFESAFHGRTMGSQLAGGIAAQREWIVGEGETFVRVPFPDGYLNEDTSFDLFESSLDAASVTPQEVACIIVEPFQGVGPDFLPTEYARRLQAFCREHDIVLIFDEIQGGFGRTGRMFGFEHYGIEPDLIVCGKGLSSSLPISAVIGRADIMDLYPPGSMTSTHSGSPLPTVAALENLRILQNDRLVEHAAAMGPVLAGELERIRDAHPDVVGCVRARGLVGGVRITEKGSTVPDGAAALRINEKCFQSGLLMFAPVGLGGGCVKIAPPLCITEDALREGLTVLAESCDEVLEA